MLPFDPRHSFQAGQSNLLGFGSFNEDVLLPPPTAIEELGEDSVMNFIEEHLRLSPRSPLGEREGDLDTIHPPELWSSVLPSLLQERDRNPSATITSKPAAKKIKLTVDTHIELPGERIKRWIADASDLSGSNERLFVSPQFVHLSERELYSKPQETFFHLSCGGVAEELARGWRRLAFLRPRKEPREDPDGRLEEGGTMAVDLDNVTLGQPLGTQFDSTGHFRFLDEENENQNNLRFLEDLAEGAPDPPSFQQDDSALMLNVSSP